MENPQLPVGHRERGAVERTAGRHRKLLRFNRPDSPSSPGGPQRFLCGPKQPKVSAFPLFFQSPPSSVLAIPARRWDWSRVAQVISYGWPAPAWEKEEQVFKRLSGSVCWDIWRGQNGVYIPHLFWGTSSHTIENLNAEVSTTLVCHARSPRAPSELGWK